MKVPNSLASANGVVCDSILKCNVLNGRTTVNPTLQPLQVKICGITQVDQAIAIANLGASALGFICVEASPRHMSPTQIRAIVSALMAQSPDSLTIHRVGVFADAPLDLIKSTIAIAGLSSVQLHGGESPTFCHQLHQARPDITLIKAFRVKSAATLQQLSLYESVVDSFLLDAYHPEQLGGTGQALDWQSLQTFRPSKPWFLAGGLNPENVVTALSQTHPDGIDLSSGVERSPGDKDLAQVRQLFSALQAATGRGQITT